MAQKVNITLVDDIDGSDATETIRFGLDGANYEIDLNDKNATKLRNALANYVGNARKVAGTRRASRRSTPAAGGASPAEIRDWARSNDMDVPERGRIPAAVREAFDAAN